MMGFGYGLGTFGWGFSMLISMLLPFVLIVGAVYLALSLWGRGRKGVVVGETEPFVILKQRLAKGEIDKDEYDRLKAELSEE